ncbi:MAG: hypothetical protein ACYDHY_06980 [Acidiferrobacterales bacterium]
MSDIGQKVLDQLAMQSMTKESLIETLKLSRDQIYDFGVELGRLIFTGRIELDPHARYVSYRLTLHEHAQRIGSDARSLGC